jgi:hypothetical protein
MNKKSEEAQRFRQRAEELRSMSSRFSPGNSDAIMLIAAHYDRLAALCERHAHDVAEWT